jgi:hypothetical protein
MSGTITRIGATGAGVLLTLGVFAAPPAGATGRDRDGKSHRTRAACFTADGHTQGRSQSDPDGMTNGGFDKPGCTGGFDADRDGNNGCGNDADREDDNNGRCGRSKDRPATEPRAEKADAAKVKADKVKVEAEKQERHDDDAKGDGRCDKHDGSTTTTPTDTAVAGASTTSAKCACPVDSEDEFASAARVSASGSVAASAVEVDGTTADAGATAAGTDAAAGATTTAPAVEAPTTATAPGTEVLGESITRPSALARTGAGLGGLALLGGLLCGGGRVAILARRFLRIG